MSSPSASDLSYWMAHPDQIQPNICLRLVTRIKSMGVCDETLDEVRCLRNCAAVNAEQKHLMVEDQALLDAFILLITDFELDVTRSERSWIPIRVTLQVLHNVFVNESCAFLVTHLNHISHLLGAKDAKTVNFAASVMGHVIQVDPNKLTAENWESLLKAVVTHESNFALLSINTVLKLNPSAILNCYEAFKVAQRCIFLDILIENEKECCSNPTVIDLVRFRFKQQSTQILTAMKASKQPLEPSEVIRLLQILIMVSAEESTKSLIQDDKSLLIDTVYLLRMIHDLGKEDPNSPFAPVRKVSEEGGQRSLETDPAFGFKRDLVRLLGNLCWNHKSNQDEVRELDGIALILDCTSIDERNEFIKEWALFALRNLCSDNRENQAYLSKVDRNGPIQADLEKEFGIKLKL